MLSYIWEWLGCSYWMWPVVEGRCLALDQMEVEGQGELVVRNTLVTAVELDAVVAAVVNAAMSDN
jgi:hypothetical protein